MVLKNFLDRGEQVEYAGIIENIDGIVLVSSFQNNIIHSVFWKIPSKAKLLTKCELYYRLTASSVLFFFLYLEMYTSNASFQLPDTWLCCQYNIKIRK